MIADFIRVTRPDSQGSASANTFAQLSTKTWAAIQKWHKLSMASHWFESTSQLIYSPESRESWFLSAQSSNNERSQAGAGQHAENSTSYYLNDECSEIGDELFVVQEGGMTDGEPMQFLFGNPTRSMGKLYRAIWGNEKSRYIGIVLDSRSCTLTNKAAIQEWVDFYGEESDFVKVRVRGLPPSVSDTQFIGIDAVNAAMSPNRIAAYSATDALIAGCDLSWGGNDPCCVRFRRGFDARTIPPIKVQGEFTRDPNTMVRVLSEVLTKSYNGKTVDILFMDSAGICGPIALKLRQLGFGDRIIEVNFGAHSADPKYKLMRSYMWGMVKQDLQWLALDNSEKLSEDLTAPSYEITKLTEILLEPKEILRKPERLGRSTDDGDALALTYAMPVITEAVRHEKRERSNLNFRPPLTAWS